MSVRNYKDLHKSFDDILHRNRKWWEQPFVGFLMYSVEIWSQNNSDVTAHSWVTLNICVIVNVWIIQSIQIFRCLCVNSLSVPISKYIFVKIKKSFLDFFSWLVLFDICHKYCKIQSISSPLVESWDPFVTLSYCSFTVES